MTTKVTAGVIAANAVNSAQIISGSIDTTHIASGQVTTAKIADSNVTTAKIADSNITTAKINDDAVTSAKLDTNIDIAGTFDVTGATTLDSTLSVSGNATFDTSTFIVDATNNNILAGTTSVGDRNTHTISKGSGFALEVEQTSSSAGASVLGLTFPNVSPDNATDYFIYGQDSSGGNPKFKITSNGGAEFTNTVNVVGDLTVDTTTLHVDSTNNRVGIGTASPSVALDVSQASARIKVQDGTDQLNIGLWDGTNYRIEGDSNRKLLITSYHTDGIHLGDSGTSDLVIKGSKVGIGTDSPNQLLDLEGAISDQDPLLLGTVTGTPPDNFNWVAEFMAGSLSTDTRICLALGKARSNNNSAVISYIQKSDTNTNALTFSHFGNNDLMNLTYAGSLGVGTTTPNTWASYTDSAATVVQAHHSNNRARLVAQGGNGAHLDLVDKSGGTNDKHLNLSVDSGYGKFGSLNDAGNAWVQQNILYMDLGTGNVGIGEAASASDKLVVNGKIYVAGNQIQGQTALMGSNSGWATFGSNSSGTGVAISRDFNVGSYPDIVVTGAGNVGIGRDSANSKLHVAGDVTIGSGVTNDSQRKLTSGGCTIIEAADSNHRIIIRGKQDGSANITANTNTMGFYEYGGYEFITGQGVSRKQALTIQQDGDVGLGTENPADKFHTYHTSAENWRFENGTSGTTGKIYLKTRDNSDLSKYLMMSSYWTEMGVHNNEGFRIRGSDGNIKFTVVGSSGNVSAAGTISDENFKTDIENIGSASHIIKLAKPKTFKFTKHSDRKSAGFIAQDMRNILPDLVTGTDYNEEISSSGLGFDYIGYTAYLTKALQEALTEIDSLKARIEALEE